MWEAPEMFTAHGIAWVAALAERGIVCEVAKLGTALAIRFRVHLLLEPDDREHERLYVAPRELQIFE
jgi:hypothetical protein